ncbi:MAG: ABC transporter ATP-binding protein [Pleurocapsa sp. MO_226.B13]|nr:ABC transporter ATP-binding protein [Pleurocapsa sp. MO_226.B13]
MIDLVFKLSGNRKPLLQLGTGFQVMASLFAVAPYWFLYLVLRGLWSESIEWETVIELLVGIAICLLLQGIFLYWANYFIYLASYRSIGDLRLRVGNHLRTLPMGFFTSRQVGDLNGLVTDDMTKIEMLPSLIYPKTVSAIATPIFFSGLLLFIDWRLTLAAFAGVPVALSIYLGGQNLLRKLTAKQKQAAIAVNSRIIEYIQGLSVIKAFNQTGEKFTKLSKALADYRRTNVDLVLQLVTPTIAFAGVLELGFVAIVATGFYFWYVGDLTVATFLLFLILGLRFYAPLFPLFEFAALTRMVNAAIDRLEGVLQTPSLPEPQNLGSPPADLALEFKDVSFSYENTTTLQNISFYIPERSVTALVGLSGAGKTTITNLIARFWDVDRGEICLGGINIKNMTTDELLSEIAMVFQDVYLFNDTILNNLKFGNPQATKQEVISAAKLARCHDFITNLPQGYETVIGEGGANLSGGEKQRIAIARAILKDAPIVLLDEATASVDPENELLIQQAINSLVESKTLIIIAHQLATIVNADQILVLDRGKIVQRGKHQELVTQDGLYQRLWQARQQAKGWKLATSTKLSN